MNWLQIFRIVKAKHANTAFDGEGAKLFGGRWNHEGSPVVYASGSLALAALEMLVKWENFPNHVDFVSVTASLPSDITIQTLENLPTNWNVYPVPATTQECGTEWLKNQSSAVLKLPSVIIQTEFNYLLNPLHPDFKKIQIENPTPFSFDQRLITKYPR